MSRDFSQIYKWKKDNIKRFEFYINKNVEPELIKYLENIPNRQAYILDLIRKDKNKYYKK